MGYAIDEQETTCLYDYTLDQWTVYSTVRKHINRMFKRYGEPEWVETELDKHGNPRIIAAKWIVPGNAVRFASIPARKAVFSGDQDEEG